MVRDIQTENYLKSLIRELRTNEKALTLEERKELFKTYVKEACNRFKISLPSINFETIGHFSNGEDGHFHPDLCMICVDEGKLKFLKEDKIKELAYHEVTHAFNGEHDKDFWNKMREGIRGQI
jgi:hypothetical protein